MNCELLCSITKLCPTLCDHIDCSPPVSSVHGIFQARILEWATISYSRGSSQPRDGTCLSCISCIGRWILHHYASWEVPHVNYNSIKLEGRIPAVAPRDFPYSDSLPSKDENWKGLYIVSNPLSFSKVRVQIFPVASDAILLEVQSWPWMFHTFWSDLHITLSQKITVFKTNN